MRFLQLGCSHHDAPVEFRERIAFSSDEVKESVVRFHEEFPQCEIVIVSTCNRTEAYVASIEPDQAPSRDAVIDFLARARELPADSIKDHLVHRFGLDAIRHLFRVASSLDSVVIGEAQILSQVKSAYELTSTTFESSPVMNTVFQHAFKAAKRVSTETSIQRKRVSVPSVAVSDFAKRIFERFDDKRVLVVGAGEMAEETLVYLQELGAQQITVTNRNVERGQNLAEKWQASFRPWEQRVALLPEVDIVITATGATDPIVTYDDFMSIEKQRAQRTTVILDLAVPRDFDTRIGELPGVFLFTVDDLQQVCDKNRTAREKELPKAEKIVNQEADRFLADWNVRLSGLTIRQLRQKAEEIKANEFGRLVGKLNELDDSSRQEIEKSFDRLVNKLLHTPLESLRDEARQGTHSGLLTALKRLFQLSD